MAEAKPTITPSTLPVCGPDLEDLRASGLTDETIRANLLRTEYDPGRLAKILNRGAGSDCCLGGLVFPYRDLGGKTTSFARVQPHVPRVRDGEPIEYEQPVGKALRAYYPQASLQMLRDGASPIFITEGEKKALALSQLGLAVVGIGGVWGWKVEDTDELIEDLSFIDLTGREAFIVFDYDRKPETRLQTAEAARRLARALRKVGAKEVDAVPDFALQPNLIETIRRDIAAVGLVGESDNGLLVYLAYSSRMLDKPLSVIIKGRSGSGKDMVQRRPADLMPPEDIVDAMDLTPKALFYVPEDGLRNKIVLGGERSQQDTPEQRDRTRALRMLLGQGYISQQTVDVNRQGQGIRRDGPISYSETTTLESIFQEDANRCLQIEADDTPEQTQAVVDTIFSRYDPGAKDFAEQVEQVKHKHHLFQRSLQPVDVRIPYATALADLIPTARVEMRRISGYVLSLIEVIAYLHQHQRRPDDQGCLLATLDDYALARRLIVGPLHQVIGGGSQGARVQAAYDRLPRRDTFTSTEAGRYMGCTTRRATQEQLTRLEQAGMIRQIRAGKGNQPAQWERTGLMPDSPLPTVEDLRASWKE
jgi:hypothetical protein